MVLGLWSIPVLTEVNQSAMLSAESGEAFGWPRVLVMAGFWYSWALLTPIIFRLTRWAPVRRPSLWRHLGIHVAVGSVLAMVFIAVLVVALPPSPDAPSELAYLDRFLLGLASGYPSMMTVYGALVAIGMGLDLRERYRAGQLRSARLEGRLVEAQLAALRMQLQPHFLFNTLHAVSALMDDDVPAARRMIARLSELLRVTLASNGQPEVPLEREIEVLERYLDIERVRLGDRLRVEYAIDEAALPIQVPVLLLQPLVENAVRHGIAPVAAPGCVRISAHLENDLLQLAVEDDGPGLVDEALARTDGIGLANTRARLEQRYGPAASFTIEGGADGGVAVRIALPVTFAPDDRAAGNSHPGQKVDS